MSFFESTKRQLRQDAYVVALFATAAIGTLQAAEQHIKQVDNNNHTRFLAECGCGPARSAPSVK